MNVSEVSRKFGWYLAKITASIEDFKNVVATSLETIKKYNLQPGKYIKISSLVQADSKKKFLEKFILLPYFKEFIKNYWLLNDVLQSLAKTTFQYIDKEYISEIIKLMSSFHLARNNKKGLRLKEVFEFDHLDKYQMKIAMPESWLNQHSVDLGEIVLLRNDVPSSTIL